MKFSVSFFGDLKKLNAKVNLIDIKSIADIVSQIPELEAAPLNFIVARNGINCDLNTEIEENDDIRFYPMVMGG